MNAVIFRTATGKEQALVKFYEQLARDGHTVTTLAEKARVGRASLTEVFNGRRSGMNTWKHVLPLLSAEALSLLKLCSAWNMHATHASMKIEFARRIEAHRKSIEILCLTRPAGPPYFTGGMHDSKQTLP